jgi:hypothetical protein
VNVIAAFRVREVAIAALFALTLEAAAGVFVWKKARARLLPLPQASALIEVPVLIEPARGFGLGPMPKPRPAPQTAQNTPRDPKTPARNDVPEHRKDGLRDPLQDAGARDRSRDASVALPATSAPEPGTASASSAVPSAGATASAPSSDSTASAASAASAAGAPGGDGDPLAAQQAGLYRGQLDGWFSSRFLMRGKLPFDELKPLRGVAIVDVNAERQVTGFRIVKPSGNAIFDAELQRTLAQIQASGAELPAPPESHREFLGAHVTLSFSCTSKARCE